MTETYKTGKRALLIGINSYPNLPTCSQLKGCVNDVLLMKDVLETSFGFPANNIVVLRDQEATGARIRQALADLLDQCQTGDIVVFHFSGHGSQMAAQGDKSRGYDESIMPSDSGRMNCGFPKEVPPNDIRDTEIEAWLSRLAEKTSRITLIFDSCHSGSITRVVPDTEGTRLRWVPPDPLPAGNGSSIPPLRNVSGSGWLSRSSSYVLLAACAAEQGAYEMDHDEEGSLSRNGAFTFFLAQEFRQATSTITYQDVWERVALNVNNRFRNQTPQLEGARDRQLFDVHDIKPMRYLLVTNRDKDQVALAGGAVHGVSANSRWKIFQAATKELDELNGNELGTVQIASVDALVSRGLIVSETAPMAIKEGDRAVETLHIDRETRMNVFINPPLTGFERQCSELRHKIDQSGLLRIDDSSSDARVVLQMTMVPEDLQEEKGPAKWDICDQSGARLMPQYSVQAPGSAARIRDNLETMWRYQKVLELRNRSSALQNKVDFFLLKQSPNGDWHEVEGDQAHFVDGEKIAFRVVNRTGRAIHASIIDLGISRQISLLYPPASASEEVAASRSAGDDSSGSKMGVLSVGEQAGSEIELYFPNDASLVPLAENQSGKEFFKLVVTTRRHDLSFLSQPGLRKNTELPEHPLGRLIYLTTGQGLERETRLSFNSNDDWLTIERSFWLSRKG